MTGETLEKKLCIACGCEIPFSASLCSECSSFQVGWKNTVRFLANVVGIASVIIAVVTYVVSTFPQLRRIAAWNESVRVLTFNYKEYAFANEGDGEVFLSHISGRYRLTPSDPIAGTYLEPIQKVVMPGSVLTGETEVGNRLDTTLVVSHVPDREWSDLFDSSVPLHDEGCVHKAFIARSDPKFIMWKSFLGDNLRTFVVEAQLHYYSPHKRSMQATKFDAVGVLMRDPKCQSKN